MECQECKQQIATVHWKTIMNGEKREVHLCEQCAEKKGASMMPQSFSLHQFLAGLLHLQPTVQEKVNSFKTPEVIQCPECKITYPQFAKAGRFGCVHCYEMFHTQLEPLLRRLHSGNIRHVGKIPKRIGGDIHARRQVEELKQNLQQLIILENFEEAAIVRDHIKELESGLGRRGE